MKKFILIIGFLFSFFPYVDSLNYYRREEELNVIITSTPALNVQDVSLVSRIIHAYQFADKQPLGNSMWQLFFNERHAAIHDIFEKGEVEKARNILQNPSSTDLFYGIDCLCYTVLNLYKQDFKLTENYSKACLDTLIRFGEAIGATTLDNPEGYHNLVRTWNVEHVIQAIESSLGIHLTFPNPYPKELGLKTSRGVLSYRVSQALYQAYLIKKLMKGIENPKVLEIGAGVGRTAYYARLLGIKDYTIIDIPMTAACSSYFLGRTLGEEEILLIGETCQNPETRVKILTPDQFLSSNQQYDLIINVDSLTEMDITNAKAYVNKITESTPIFASINHEINPFTVRQCLINHPFLKDYQRNVYWMRTGYVEEIFKFSSN